MPRLKQQRDKEDFSLMPYAIYSMTCVAPTVATCLGLRELAHATGEAIAELVADLSGAERVAIVVPDALGQHSFERFADEMPFLRSLCEKRHLVLRSVMPSVTPVNFATMVSGCDLEVHGVRSKNMDFACETLFDVLAEAGRRGAGCGRPGYTGSELLARVAQIDGTAALSDDAAIEEAILHVAREHRPEFIIAQIGGTDDHFHRFGPRSPRMIPKLRETDCRLQRLVVELTAGGYAVIVLADHGQHESGDPDKPGTHGSDSDEDCLVPCTWVRAGELPE